MIANPRAGFQSHDKLSNNNLSIKYTNIDYQNDIQFFLVTLVFKLNEEMGLYSQSVPLSSKVLNLRDKYVYLCNF